MAFTGNLEKLHLVDVIQLLHTTRQSGSFSVKGKRGESQIIFSNGHIVAANHLNNKVRIGSVLVKMNAITPEDLKESLEVQKNAGKDRKPLIATLIELGMLRQEEASKGLKKLIEITIVEFIGLTDGIFTFDTEAISVSPECSYLPGEMEQEMSLDAQMVLMDALRIFDERKRDSESGKDMPSYEELYGEVIPAEAEGAEMSSLESPTLTADDLGLSDVDRLEQKLQQSFSVKTIFDPLTIHRQQIQTILPDFSDEEKETFVSFLKKYISHVNAHEVSARWEGQANALILFSRDKLIKHSLMTIYKNEGILVFATDREEEFDYITSQCFSKEILPILVYDSPEKSEAGLSEEKIVSLRQQIKEKYPQVTQIQLVFPLYYAFTLQSYNDGVIAVLPKPLKDARKDTYIEDTIQFLETFKIFIKRFLHKQKDLSTSDNQQRNSEITH